MQVTNFPYDVTDYCSISYLGSFLECRATWTNAEKLMKIRMFELMYLRKTIGICFIKLLICFFFCSFSAIICCLIFDASLIEIGRMQVLLLYPEANFGYILQNVCLCLLALLYQWITQFAEKGVRFQKFRQNMLNGKLIYCRNFFLRL